MTADILDKVTSLVAILEEETEKLAAPGQHPDLAELASAKGRLVAGLERQIAQCAREQADWVQALEPDARTELAAGFERLHQASVVNADVLRRQIELSVEMMAAVAAEAQRLTGTSTAMYGAHGALFQVDQATPISLNARM